MNPCPSGTDNTLPENSDMCASPSVTSLPRMRSFSPSSPPSFSLRARSTTPQRSVVCTHTPTVSPGLRGGVERVKVRLQIKNRARARLNKTVRFIDRGDKGMKRGDTFRIKAKGREPRGEGGGGSRGNDDDCEGKMRTATLSECGLTLCRCQTGEGGCRNVPFQGISAQTPTAAAALRTSRPFRSLSRLKHQAPFRCFHPLPRIS